MKIFSIEEVITLPQLKSLYAVHLLIEYKGDRNTAANSMGVSVKAFREYLRTFDGGLIKTMAPKCQAEIEPDLHVYGLPSNEDRLQHLDNIINRDRL